MPTSEQRHYGTELCVCVGVVCDTLRVGGAWERVGRRENEKEKERERGRGREKEREREREREWKVVKLENAATQQGQSGHWTVCDADTRKLFDCLAAEEWKERGAIEGGRM